MNLEEILSQSLAILSSTILPRSRIKIEGKKNKNEKNDKLFEKTI